MSVRLSNALSFEGISVKMQLNGGTKTHGKTGASEVALVSSPLWIRLRLMHMVLVWWEPLLVVTSKRMHVSRLEEVLRVAKATQHQHAWWIRL